ncbi:MAG: tyrosine-protein phosphatase, partial [Lachnospiraceae bacterium]|nr:tyrosine-protein phosphatase [Lachnospiraceae bacterium]
VEIQTSGASFSDGGDLVLAIDADAFRQSGYAFGDIINIKVDGKDYTAPVVSFATEADEGQPAVVDASGPVWIALNSESSFAETSGLAQKTAAEDGTSVWTMPGGRTPDTIPVTITMSEKGGFLTAYYTRHLVFSSDRADYVSDEVYANFREVRGGAFPDGMLYRGCTPIEDYYGRTQTADAMLEKYDIRTVINLANTGEDIESRIAAPDFVSPNYAALYAEGSVGAYPLKAVYTTDEERAQIAAALRFMIDHKGPYYLHCVVGKDRTGFMSMLLSFYMGVPLRQVLNDYMLTYTNIFTIEPGSDQYTAILNFFPVIDLKIITGLDSDDLSDYEELDMVWEAENYIRGLGLTDSECALLRRQLTGA